MNRKQKLIRKRLGKGKIKKLKILQNVICSIDMKTVFSKHTLNNPPKYS